MESLSTRPGPIICVAAMLDALVGRLVMSGLSARAAIADTWGAVHALERYAANPMCLVAPGTTEAVLASSPMETLRLSPVISAGLRDLGFTCIGDLIGQPRAALTRRFGPELCRQLDQDLGGIAEPIQLVPPDDLIESSRSFAEPIAAAETIARYIGKLVLALCERLEERGLGARRLDLLCHRIDNDIQIVRIRLAKARP